MTFDSRGAAAEPIRVEESYNGIRVTLGGALSRAVVRFLDVNVGDPIWPEPQQFSLPRLIDGVISSYEKRAAQRKNDFEVLTRIEART